ncbi:ubiquinone biosynthesis protein COQ9, mitochondrial [Culex quinquefasciatus]|uniref:Ubiquinone biosynthesis protein n=1 Tax=Culex quinquefasciatus TaxID=7176 RepID=B0X0M6_CULQU|nr:ubiquinone biosynthesis protein COQ9, mitochondrial [Culex quinquefasciatus]|eukprot:XP_001863198.1 ubiquinone biosynthesis protein COQ9, mitochondrial [Culex quinquefasciatus]
MSQLSRLTQNIRMLRTCSYLLRLYSTDSGSNQPRESFSEFRAREELKEQQQLLAQQQTPDQSSSTGGANQPEQEDPQVATVKDRILEASLAFVPSHGWSRQSLAKGAESVNYPTVTSGLFPRGGIEIVQFFHKRCNEQLVDYMKQEVGAPADPAAFAQKAIEVRLRMLIPYMKQWPQAMALMTLPQNVTIALSNVLTISDNICYYAGDRSVDFNWYTRRIGLAGIYKMTELYMLQDASPDYARTWSFLEHRVQEGSKMDSLLLKSEDATAQLQSAVSSVFSTARNILGMGFERR